MLYHPENGAPLVDRFGVPVYVNAFVVIARKSSRYGGAQLVDAVVRKITPLVLHPRYGGYDPAKWYNTSTHSRLPLVREDQLAKSHQTEYLSPLIENGQDPDWQRCFVASVEVKHMARLHTVPYGYNLLITPRLITTAP